MMQRDARLTARKNHKEKTFQWLWHRNKDVNEKFTPAHMCKELGKLCKCRAGMWKRMRTFGGFKRRATSFCVAGVALCDIIRCRKSFCLTGAILLRGGQKMSCILWSAGLDSWTLLISVVGGRCRPKLVRQRCQWLLDGFRFLGEREVPRGGWLILRHPSRDSCPEPCFFDLTNQVFLLRSKAPSHLFLPVCLSACLSICRRSICLCVNLYMSAIMQADISWKQCANVWSCVSSVDFFCPSTSSTAFFVPTLLRFCSSVFGA